jgi:23S rRNA (guanosine2251-2'-O)-methyltransferase
MAASQLIYGHHTVAAVLGKDALNVMSLWAQDNRHDARMRQLLAQAAAAEITIYRVPRQHLDDLVGDARHQGVVASYRGAAGTVPTQLPQLLAGLAEAPLLLALDGVQDPHNLGACLRSADAAGVHALVAPRHRAAGLSASARKVACGAAESVPFVQVANLARTLRELRAEGMVIAGACGDQAVSLYEADLRGPLVFVLGGEARGLRRLTREACDLLVGIPMLGSVNSLNVSVATALCLYEVRRQRGFRAR